MMQINRRAVALASLAALVAGGAVVVRSATAADETMAPAAAQVGQAAPSFELKDQDGKTVSLADFKDRVVVLEWFNDGCPFVQKWYKQGDMNRVAADAQAKGVVWLAVNSTNGTDAAHNKQVAGKWKVEHPILDDSAGKVGHLYGAKTTPQMYVINKGTLVYDGAIDGTVSTDASDIKAGESYVAKALDEVLADKPVTNAQNKSYGCSVKYAK